MHSVSPLRRPQKTLSSFEMDGRQNHRELSSSFGKLVLISSHGGNYYCRFQICNDSGAYFFPIRCSVSLWDVYRIEI